jgi:CrcB protein
VRVLRPLGDSLRRLVLQEPVDPDLAPVVSPALAPVPTVVAVSAGGVVGALGRHAVQTAWPPSSGAWGWPTLVVNSVGCFLLAVLLVTMTRRLPRARYSRPLLATGLLGGFTTFAGFAVDAVLTLDAGRPAAAAAHLGVMTAAMLAATVIGVLVARAALERPPVHGRP